MNEILSITVLGLAAFLAAIGSLLSIALVLHWGHKREEGLMAYIYYPMILLIASNELLSERNLYLASYIETSRTLNMMLPGNDLYSATTAIVGTQHPLYDWASRLNSLFILLAACERIARRFLYYGNKPDAPILLIIALWVYFLTNIVSPGFLGAQASFSYYHLYMVLAGSGALLLSQQEGDTAVRAARNSIFIIILLSAVTLVFRPEMVIDPNYQGLISGFNLRYYGLTGHPNTFAPLITVFLICLWNRPFSARWVTLCGWTIGCASLVLTQSKTNLIAFSVCALCIGYFRYGDFFRQRFVGFRHPQYAVALLLVIMLSTGAIGFVVMFIGSGEAFNSFFASSKGNELMSMTGRDRIWAIAVEEWRHNPLFGYGLTIWDEAYRAHMGVTPEYVHAHNQFYQSLSSAGIVGVVGLVIYVMTLFRFALKTAKSSLGLSLSLFVIIFASSFAEVPLLIVGIGPEVLTHLLLLMVMASHLAPKNVKDHGVKKLTPHKFISSSRIV